MSQNAPDIIFLEGIEVFAHGGVTEAEQTVGQRYRLDITIEADLGRAATTDSLSDTVSYAAVHDIALRLMTSRRFALLEAQAARIADAIMTETAAESVVVRLRKLAPPVEGIVAAAGVEIRRDRKR